MPGPFDYANGVCLLTHKLEPLHGVDLRRACRCPFGPGVDRVRERRGCVPARRGMGRCGTRAPPSGRGARHRARQRVSRGRRDRRHRAPCSVRRLAAPRSYRGRPAEETVSRAALLQGYGDPRLDVRDVAIRARNGDRRARRVFDGLASALGEITAPWLDSFGASCLVVGGSISQAWDLLGRGLHAALVRRRRPPGDRPRRACRRRRATRRGAPYGRDGRPPCSASFRHGRERPCRLAEMTVDEARRAQAPERPSRPVDARVKRELAGSVPISLFVPRGSRSTPSACGSQVADGCSTHWTRRPPP